MPSAVLCDSSMGKEGDPAVRTAAGREGASKYSSVCGAGALH